MDLDQISKTLNSDSGRALREYLIAKLEELRSIERIAEKDTPTHQAIEIRAQLRAYQKLKEILKDLIDLSEEPKEKDPADSYEVS